MLQSFRVLFWLSLLSAYHCSAQADHITISDLWISEAPPVAKIHAGYMTITNSSDDEIILKKIVSPDYARIEMHRSIVIDDRMKMKAHRQIVIPPKQIFRFQPGDYHLMLFGPRSRLLAGDKIMLTFHFDEHLQFSLSAPVRKRKSLAK